MRLDTSFHHTYNIEFLEELNSKYDIYYYPGASRNGGKDGLIIQINPATSKPWIGVFAFGNISKCGISGCFTMPNPEKLCVLSNSTGYIVSANNPNNWEKIEMTPITDVRSVPSHEIIIFSDYTKIIAYDKKELKWKTKQLAWDNLKITEISDKCIKGVYYDIRTEGNTIFTVDLSTGD